MKKGDFKKGFTIIEVTLVLAIGGLIIAMVFVALPALRRTQRDNTRKDDLMRLISEVGRYQQSNRGSLPGSKDTSDDDGVITVTWGMEGMTDAKKSTWAGFYRDYLGEKFVDPDGEQYKLKVISCDASTSGGACKDKALWMINKLKDSPFPYDDHTILIIKQASCDGANVLGSANPRNLAALYKLEGAGSYCADM